ncbi:TRAP transporter small permease [Cohaesibacter celericrescens]|uniref:TRAP transporter small permease protein n=1 Tax=Cohaesibacter celericrescens TaxID=2067669 RepID=A0A2N5XPY5_9HYPH|nr:TRAP transporter small permease [Cohaesibacter celericrescens]PLW76589.1 TRAP transporter small permease [Cohaesibacter celericrescens]
MISWIDRLLARFESFAMAFCMALAISLTFLQVVLRYAFNAPLYWTEEVVLYSIVAMSFIGISFGFSRASHISVDILKAFMPKRYERTLRIISLILGAVFGLTVLWLGWRLTAVTFSRGQLSPALRIPMAYVYAVIPIAGGAATFRYLLSLLLAFKQSDDTPHANETPSLM